MIVDDVDKYDPGEMRYSVAREICFSIVTMLDSMTLERRNW